MGDGDRRPEEERRPKVHVDFRWWVMFPAKVRCPKTGCVSIQEIDRRVAVTEFFLGLYRLLTRSAKCSVVCSMLKYSTYTVVTDWLQ